MKLSRFIRIGELINRKLSACNECMKTDWTTTHFTFSAVGLPARVSVKMHFAGVWVIAHQATFKLSRFLVRLSYIPEFRNNCVPFNMMIVT